MQIDNFADKSFCRRRTSSLRSRAASALIAAGAFSSQ